MAVFAEADIQLILENSMDQNTKAEVLNRNLFQIKSLNYRDKEFKKDTMASASEFCQNIHYSNRSSAELVQFKSPNILTFKCERNLTPLEEQIRFENRIQ